MTVESSLILSAVIMSAITLVYLVIVFRHILGLEESIMWIMDDRPLVIDFYQTEEKAEAELEYRRAEYRRTHHEELGPGMHGDPVGRMGIPGDGISTRHIAYLYELAQAYDKRIAEQNGEAVE